MTYKVGPKGQVVVPKRIRDRLGIRPGDEVVVDEDAGEVRIRKAVRSPELSSLLGALADVPGISTAALEAEHRRELELEERKLERWRRGPEA